jgi:hypothetical protein
MESLSTERQEMVQMLMAVTGIEDAEFAREFLQDNSWQLEPAVNQFMVMTEDGGGAGGGALMAASPREAPAPSIPARPDPAPAPPVVQRLVDDMPGVDGPAQESFRNFAAAEGMEKQAPTGERGGKAQKFGGDAGAVSAGAVMSHHPEEVPY